MIGVAGWQRLAGIGRAAGPARRACVGLPQTQLRFATHKSEKVANGKSNGPGKRLGAKRTNDERVVPGVIIYRQRGTLWFAGDNCGIGRDHTIFATAEGYVKYYKDPARHPRRRYIGVVFDRSLTLPAPPNSPRRRRLGMLAYSRNDLAGSEAEIGAASVAGSGDGIGVRIGVGMGDEIGVGMGHGTEASSRTSMADAGDSLQPPLPAIQPAVQPAVQSPALPPAPTRSPTKTRRSRPDRLRYVIRESNASIGRTAERLGIEDPAKWSRKRRAQAENVRAEARRDEWRMARDAKKAKRGRQAKERSRQQERKAAADAA